MEAMSSVASNGAVSPVRSLLDDHLGIDSSTIPVVSDAVPAYDHANVQVALNRFLEVDARTHRLVGLTGSQRHFAAFSDLLETAHMMGVRVGAPDLVTLNEVCRADVPVLERAMGGAASAAFQPVSASAIGFMKCTRPCALVAITASPMLCSVVASGP